MIDPTPYAQDLAAAPIDFTSGMNCCSLLILSPVPSKSALSLRLAALSKLLTTAALLIATSLSINSIEAERAGISTNAPIKVLLPSGSTILIRGMTHNTKEYYDQILGKIYDPKFHMQINSWLSEIFQQPIFCDILSSYRNITNDVLILHASNQLGAWIHEGAAVFAEEDQFRIKQLTLLREQSIPFVDDDIFHKLSLLLLNPQGELRMNHQSGDIPVFPADNYYVASTRIALDTHIHTMLHALEDIPWNVPIAASEIKTFNESVTRLETNLCCNVRYWDEDVAVRKDIVDSFPNSEAKKLARQILAADAEYGSNQSLREAWMAWTAFEQAQLNPGKIIYLSIGNYHVDRVAQILRSGNLLKPHMSEEEQQTNFKLQKLLIENIVARVKERHPEAFANGSNIISASYTCGVAFSTEFTGATNIFDEIMREAKKEGNCAYETTGPANPQKFRKMILMNANALPDYLFSKMPR